MRSWRRSRWQPETQIEYRMSGETKMNNKNDAPRKRGRPRKQVRPGEPDRTDKTHQLGPGHMVVELDCDDTGCGQLVCLSERWWHVHIQKVGRMWRMLSRHEVTLREAVQLAVD